MGQNREKAAKLYLKGTLAEAGTYSERRTNMENQNGINKRLEEKREEYIPKKTPETVGGRIAYVRKENGLSQGEFAERVMVSRAAVSKWENDAGMPSVDSCQIISGEFDVSLDYLLMGSGTYNARSQKIREALAPKSRLGKALVSISFFATILLPGAFALMFAMSTVGSPYTSIFISLVIVPLLLCSMLGSFAFESIPAEKRDKIIWWAVTISVFAFIAYIALGGIATGRLWVPEELYPATVVVIVSFFLLVIAQDTITRMKKKRKRAAESAGKASGE